MLLLLTSISDLSLFHFTLAIIINNNKPMFIISLLYLIRSIIYLLNELKAIVIFSSPNATPDSDVSTSNKTIVSHLLEVETLQFDS